MSRIGPRGAGGGGFNVDDLNNKIVIKSSAGGTASLNEQNAIVEFQNGSNDYAWTIPPNSSVAFPVGSWMVMRKTGDGEITVTKGGGVTFRHENFGDNNVKLDGKDGYSVYIEKTGSDTWLLSGAIKAV